MLTALLQSILVSVNPYRAYQAGRDGCGGDPCAGIIVVIVVIAIYFGLKNRNNK